MANPNNSSDPKERQLAILKQAPVLYNMLNLIPSECTWYVTVNDMEKHIFNMAAQYLGASELRMVTLESGQKSSRCPKCYLWIKKNSKHLVDKTARDDSMVINPTVERFSNELKQFATQFAPTVDDEGRPINRKKLIKLYNDQNRDDSIVAIPLDLNRILQRLFDVENKGFVDTYGTGQDVSMRRCWIRCKASYDRRTDGRGQLSVLKITKYFEGVRQDHARPKPVGMFRDRDDDRDDRRGRLDD